MKANEAPEKIYFGTQQNMTNPFSGLTQKCADTDIEYTRTDAFIEKAAEWMFSQANVYTVTHVSNDGGIHTNFYADKMVEDFRKYMEGE